MFMKWQGKFSFKSFKFLKLDIATFIFILILLKMYFVNYIIINY